MVRRPRLTSIFALTAVLTLPVALPGVAGAQATAETACGTAPAGYNVIESNQRFIIGTTGPDFICAGDSNNIIRAMGKDDIIYGGGGNDVIWAGFGNDTIWAGDGADIVRAGSGQDAVSGGDGDDAVFGGDGIDTIRGEAGDDKLTGGNGHDVLSGGDGGDTLVGNSGFDQLEGGAGNDVGQGGLGNDVLLGGNGDDVLSGGDHDDVLGGGNGNDRLLGGNGNDTLTGGNGNDALIGGGNPDELRGSAGDDIVDGGNGLNLAIGGPGVDECKNADHVSTVCEIVDGIDQFEPPARIWLIVPSAESPGAVIAGTGWTAETDIDVTIVAPNGRVIGETQVVVTDETGDFELIVDADSLTNATILVGDSTAGRVKSLQPALAGFDWNPIDEDLVLTGTAGETMEAHISFPEDDLIFVEQMTFGEDGVSEANFSEVDNISEFELRRSDSDGDVEIHLNIDRIPTAVAATPVLDDAVLAQADEG